MSTYELGTISLTTWILFIFVIIAFSAVVIILILQMAGINVKEKMKKILQKVDNVVEVTSDYKYFETNGANPPELIDDETGRIEPVHMFAIDSNNKIPLFTKDDEGRTQQIAEVRHRDMLQLEDPLIALKELPGVRFRIIKDETTIRFKQEIDTLRTRIKILENERKSILEKGAVESLISEGEKQKEVRRAAYGNTSNPFKGDKYGFGNRWRRAGDDLGESSDNFEE